MTWRTDSISVATKRRRCTDVRDTAVFTEQVLVLSEGHQLYFGPPQEAVNWFSSCLGYTFWPGQHGAEADWLMDLVSVGFSKPQALCSSSMTSREDVSKASELWHAHCKKAWLHPRMPSCRACMDAPARAVMTTLQLARQGVAVVAPSPAYGRAIEPA